MPCIREPLRAARAVPLFRFGEKYAYAQKEEEREPQYLQLLFLTLFPSYTLEVMEALFPSRVFSPTRKKARALKYALAAGFASQIRLPLMS